jgi:hypothetical protein
MALRIRDERQGSETMSPTGYVISFTVEQSPEEVFDAINNVRG